MLASVALHALLLFALPMLERARKASAVPLTARLVTPKSPEAAPRGLEPTVSVPAAAPKTRPVFVAKPAPPLAFAPAPTLSVEPAKPAAESVATPAAPAATSTPAPALPTPAIGPQPTPPAASGPEPGAVARFRLELMDIARRHKRYPRIAQDNNWEGRVELRIALGEDGAISSLSVKKSAGRVVLDDEAQAMLRTAKSKATIPSALRGKAFTLEISVDFFLKDEEK